MDSLEQKTALMFPKIFLLFNLCFLISCDFNNASLPYYNTPDFTPLFLNNKIAVENKINHQIANFSFTNQNGDLISNNDIENKIHVANFIFTSCSNICPTMTSNMKNVEAAFFNDPGIQILSFSVTPWIDNPKKLKNYMKQYDIRTDNWNFLTGPKNEIYSLARESYFAEKNIGLSKDSLDFLHTEHFILVDKNKRIRGIYNGTLALEAKQLIKDITTLKKQ